MVGAEMVTSLVEQWFLFEDLGGTTTPTQQVGCFPWFRCAEGCGPP